MSRRQFGWKAMGFSQRRPRVPGVYFVNTDGHLPRSPTARLYEHWDVANIYFYAGSYDNAYENRESAAHWRVQTLSGISYCWQKGMWIKGPLHPSLCTLTEATRQRVGNPQDASTDAGNAGALEPKL